jgi:hypothetical protein
MGLVARYECDPERAAAAREPQNQIIAAARSVGLVVVGDDDTNYVRLTLEDAGRVIEQLREVGGLRS